MPGGSKYGIIHDQTMTKDVKIRVSLFAATLLSMVWGFRLLLFDHAPDVFNSTIEDLSYGWYVPVFSAYVLWRERRELAASVGAPSAWGLLLAVPSAFAGFLGACGSQIRLEIVGFVGLLAALALSFFGRRTARQALFPVLFLLFCLPLHSYLDIVTIHLRMFAVSVAYGVLQGAGVEVVRQGTMISSASGSFAIDVAEPCSGLRSLFALMALAAGYGYFTQKTWLRRALLFALSVPIAIAGNVVRILSIAVVAATCSADFATGFYHDYSGYVVFIVAVALMVAAGGLVAWLGERLALRPGKPAAERPPEQPVRAAAACGRARLAIPVAVAAFTVSVMLYQARAVNPALCEAPSVRLGEIPGYASEVVPASEAELHILPADTIIDKRLYTAEDGSWHLVTLVIGGRSKSSIHRPEMCLPSQGFLMAEPRSIEAAGVEWRCVTLRRQTAAPLGFAYTFFNQDGFRTGSHVRRIFRDVWDRSMLRRIDRWAMVTVNSSFSDDARLAAFLEKLKGVIW